MRVTGLPLAGICDMEWSIISQTHSAQACHFLRNGKRSLNCIAYDDASFLFRYVTPGIENSGLSALFALVV